MNNTATKGGAIQIDCSLTRQCANTITNCTFTDNSAGIQGGAINYNMNPPVMSLNNFNNNSAVYGDNIASYPVKIVQADSGDSNIHIEGAASGLKHTDTLSFEIIDFEGQVVNNENKDTVKIASSTSEVSLSGTNFAKINNGTIEFDNLVFIAQAGQTNVKYSVSSSAINSEILSLTVPNSSLAQYSTSLNLSFRKCKPGEYENSAQQCVECSPGTYSVEWDSKE